MYCVSCFILGERNEFFVIFFFNCLIYFCVFCFSTNNNPLLQHRSPLDRYNHWGRGGGGGALHWSMNSSPPNCIIWTCTSQKRQSVNLILYVSVTVTHFFRLVFTATTDVHSMYKPKKNTYVQLSSGIIIFILFFLTI